MCWLLWSAAALAAGWAERTVIDSPSHTVTLTQAGQPPRVITFSEIDHFEMAPVDGGLTPAFGLVTGLDERVPLSCGEKAQFTDFIASTVVRRPLSVCADCEWPAPPCPRLVLQTMSLDLGIGGPSTASLSLKKVGPSDIIGDEQPALSQQQIDQAVQPHADALLACYERQRTQKPGLSGELSVRLTVQQDGRVSEARIVEDTVGDRAVQSCVLHELRAVRFPAFEGVSFTHVSHTLSFGVRE